MNSKNLTVGLECHFNWDIRSFIGEKNIVNKLCEKNEEIDGLPWRNLLITLTIAYEMHIKNYSAANDKLQEAIVIWSNSVDEFILKYKDAFRHVIYSMKLFFVINNASKTVIKTVFDNIPEYTTFGTEQKAAILGIKAHVFSEYGVEGTKHALILAREAVKMNPKEGEWSFLVGKMLARIRHFTLDFCVTEDEIECFRHAYYLSKSAAHAIFLAQTYMTISTFLVNKLPFVRGKRIPHGDEAKIIEGYNEKAYNLYNEALKLNDNKCCHINFRCAKGFCTLPGDFKNIEKALDVVKKTLQRAPTNVYGNAVAAKIYYTLKEYDFAFKHAYAAEEGGSFGASIKILQMKVELNKPIDAVKEYERIFEKHPELIYKFQTAMNALSYFIFKKKDIYRALYYFFMAVNWDAKIDDFNYFVFWIRDATNLCFIVYNEVNVAIEGKKMKSAKQNKQLREAIIIIKEKYPKIAQRKLQPDLVDFLLKRAQRFQHKNPRYQQKFRQRNIIKPFKNKNDTNETIKKNDGDNNNSNSFNNNNNNNNNPRKWKNNSKVDGKWKRNTSRTRRDSSVCSNVSGTSVSSVASNASFGRIRRNSKEACVLDIIAKDKKLEGYCKAMEETRKGGTDALALRPRSQTDKLQLGCNSKLNNSMSMGCSGWNGKYKSQENLKYLKGNEKRLNSNNVRKPRTPAGEEFNNITNMFVNMKIDGKELNKSFSSNIVNNERKQNFRQQRTLSTCSDGILNQMKLNPRKYTGGDNMIQRNFEGNSWRRDGSGGRERGREGFERVRGGMEMGRGVREWVISGGQNNMGNERFSRESSSEKCYLNRDKDWNQNSKVTYSKGNYNKQNKYIIPIRKPINLGSRDSLDSDDSVTRYESCDGASVSSVDSDYVRNSGRSYFPWQRGPRY